MINVHYTRELKKESDNKKLFNINTFSKLDRSGLGYGEVERRLLMKEYSTGEKLYLQYPGKESARDENVRPWDFRPKLQLSNGEWLKDLSFKDVWDDLYAFKDGETDMPYLATLFFRIAYMLDSKKTTRIVTYEDIECATGKIMNTGQVELTWYEYEPSDDVIGDSLMFPKGMRGCSIYAYLAYNDYLAQNEDCKYYYRDTIANGKSWDTNTGRTNTLLTHMSVIAFMEGILRFTQITDMFQRGKGVAKLQTKYWEEVTGGRVTK